MKMGMQGQRQRSENRKHLGNRQYAQAARKAVCPMMEVLEPRMLLSISAATLVGQMLTTGAQGTYVTTSTSSAWRDTETISVSGPVTAPTGQQAMKYTFQDVDTNGTTTLTSGGSRYYALTSAGYVCYGSHDVPSSTSYDDNYSPFIVIFPAQMTAGQDYYSSYENDWVDTDPHGGSTSGKSEHNRIITLESETTESVTVPAGTFNAYEVTVVDETVNGGTNTSHVYYAPGVGEVKEVSGDSTTTNTTVLTAWSGVHDTLVFDRQPTNTPEGDRMEAITVELHDKDGLDADSTAEVTLTLSSTTGELSGTTTMEADGGVATFADLSIDKSGEYTLTATCAVATPATSDKFKIVGDHLVFTKDPLDTGLNDPIRLVVSFEDKNNKVDTAENGTVELTLNIIKDGEDAVLGGTVMGDLVDGVATFAPPDAPSIDVAGTYTLTATQVTEDPDTGGWVPVETTDKAVSHQFITADDHLVFKKAPPATVDVNAPIPFVVEVLDSKQRVDTRFSDEIEVTLNVVKGDHGAQLSTTVPVAFVNGVATFTSTSGPSIDLAGTYTLKVTPVEEDPDTGLFMAVESAASVTSDPIKVGGDHMVLVTQPVDTDVNDGIAIKIEILDDKNKIDTSVTSEAEVTLKTITGGSDATLAGTTTISFVDGVADFPASATVGPDTSLSIDLPGSYALVVTEMAYDENTQDYAPSTTSDPVTSNTFKVNGDHLKFSVQPTDGDVNSPLVFTVQLLDSKNKIVTESTTNRVEISLDSVSGGQTAELDGATTVTLTNGMAKFTANSNTLMIDKPGTFTLTATEESYDADSEEWTPVNTTEDGISNQFKITGDHLVFLKQPGKGEADAPIPFLLALKDLKNKTVTTDDGKHIEYTLNVISGGKNATLAGTNPVDLVNGLNDNSSGDPDAALSIGTPGTYTLTAEEVDGEGDPVDTTTAVTSKPFTIAGDHLVFIQQPGNSDVESSINFKVELLDAKNRIVTTDDENAVKYTLQIVKDGKNATLDGSNPMDLVRGINDATKANSAVEFTIDTPGTYTLTAEEVDSDGKTIDTTTAVTSQQFVIAGDHLVFLKQPGNNDVNAPLSFKVELLDSKNKVVTDNDTDSIFYTLTVIKDGKTTALVGPNPMELVKGISEATGTDPATSPKIDTPGTYTLTAEEIDGEGNPIDTTTPVTSQQFKIAGNHLVFLQQPSNGDVTSPLSFKVELLDAKNRVVTTNDTDSVLYTLSVIADGHNAEVIGTNPADLVKGISDNTRANPAADLQIDVPGTYTLTAVEVDDQYDPIDTTTPVTSKQFKIAGNHLVFVQQPGNGDMDEPFPFKVVIMNSKNKIVSTETNSILFSLHTIGGGSGAAIVGENPAALVQGMFVNSSANKNTGLSIDVPGAYSLTVAEVDGEGDPIDATTPATSKSFTISGYHLVFLSQALTGTVNGGLSLVVALEDSKNRVVSDLLDATEQVNLTLVASSRSSAQMAGTTFQAFINGVATFSAAGGPRIDTAGLYTIDATLADEDGQSRLDLATSSALSKPIRISR